MRRISTEAKGWAGFAGRLFRIITCDLLLITQAFYCHLSLDQERAVKTLLKLVLLHVNRALCSPNGHIQLFSEIVTLLFRLAEIRISMVNNFHKILEYKYN